MKRGHVYEQMIYDIVEEIENDVVSSYQLIGVIAASLDRTYKEVYKDLKEIDSPFPSKIVGFIDGKPIKNRIYHHHYTNTLKKVKDKIGIIEDQEDALYVLSEMFERLNTDKQLKWRETNVID